MTLRMIWFLPVGLTTGMVGAQVARDLLRQGRARHHADAWFMVILAWFPLAAWLLNQVFAF